MEICLKQEHNKPYKKEVDDYSVSHTALTNKWIIAPTSFPNMRLTYNQET